jgi:type VI secretion system secreted protein Hcp
VSCGNFRPGCRRETIANLRVSQATVDTGRGGAQDRRRHRTPLEEGERLAVDYFLKIDGIPGESKDSKHKDEIDVEAWSWGEVNPVQHGSGSGAGAGKVQVQDFNFTARFSKASPSLMLSCASGKHLKSAVLTARRGDKAQAEFLTFSLSDVLVSSYQTAGAEAGDVAPVDSVSLNFSKIQIEYKEQKADGSLGGSIKAGWDVKQNKQL